MLEIRVKLLQSRQFLKLFKVFKPAQFLSMEEIVHQILLPAAVC